MDTPIKRKEHKPRLRIVKADGNSCKGCMAQGEHSLALCGDLSYKVAPCHYTAGGKRQFIIFQRGAPSTS